MSDFSPDFPVAYWPAWDADANFAPGDALPPDSKGHLWAVLTFVFYGDKVVLADIEGRGWCIPSGRIEAGETIDETCEREVLEETGARLSPERRRLIGCYRLMSRSGKYAGQARWCPVFVADALGFEPIPDGSESRGCLLAAVEDVADLYFFWDALVSAVFSFAHSRKESLFPAGLSLSDFTS